MIKPKILNVMCPQCELSWLVPLNKRTYICPCCEFVAFERDLKGMKRALYQ